jgi:hypothetical protein
MADLHGSGELEVLDVLFGRGECTGKLGEVVEVDLAMAPHVATHFVGGVQDAELVGPRREPAPPLERSELAEGRDGRLVRRLLDDLVHPDASDDREVRRHVGHLVMGRLGHQLVEPPYCLVVGGSGGEQQLGPHLIGTVGHRHGWSRRVEELAGNAFRHRHSVLAPSWVRPTSITERPSTRNGEWVAAGVWCGPAKKSAQRGKNLPGRHTYLL